MSCSDYLETLVPHFHVCNGPRPGGHFLQTAAWQVNDDVVDHVARTCEAFSKTD